MQVAEAVGSTKPAKPEVTTTATVRPERPARPPRAETPEMPAEAEVELSPAAQDELEPPNFNRMTEEEQYAYLQEVVVETAGDSEAWNTGANEVNLIGIRSFQNGEPVQGRGNTYDDTIYAAWVDEEGEVHVESFQATTDAGVDTGGTQWGYTDANGNDLNFSHLADGHYRDTWRAGTVNGEAGLRQSANILIHADANNDGVIQDSERLGADQNGDGLGDGVTVGAGWGIQFHRGGAAGTAVNTWSAGCQVIVSEDYERFQDVIARASNTSFSYTLVDSSSLPGADGSLPVVAAPAPTPAPAVGATPAETPVPSPRPAASGTPATPAPAATTAPAPAATAAAPAPAAVPPQHPADTPVPQDLAGELETMAGRPMPGQFDLLLQELVAALLSSWTVPRLGSAWGMAMAMQSSAGQSLTMLEMAMLRALNMGVAVDPAMRATASRFLTF